MHTNMARFFLDGGGSEISFSKSNLSWNWQSIAAPKVLLSSESNLNRSIIFNGFFNNKARRCNLYVNDVENDNGTFEISPCGDVELFPCGNKIYALKQCKDAGNMKFLNEMNAKCNRSR